VASLASAGYNALVLALHTGALCAVLVGIGVRQRARATFGFVAYLLATLSNNITQLLGVFTRDDWFGFLSVQLVQRSLTLAVAVEIGARILHANVAPTGRAYVGRAVLVVLFLGLVAAVTWGYRLEAARTDADVYYALVDAERRVSITALWAFIAVFGIADMRFHWPIDPYHRDIGIGFSAYLAAVYLFAPGPDMPFRLPPSWPVWLYTAVLLLWLRAAWRHDDFTRVDPRFRRAVFPWARHD
jgi:hypothetical protein